MKQYGEFVWKYRRILGFGLLLALLSSFGQTFLFSLFVPHWLEEFGMDRAGFGRLYSTATLLSAACLPWVGAWLDRTSARRFALGVLGFLGLSALVLQWASSAWVLFVGVFGVRFAGQGLCSHTASTTMARTFHRSRGKALSVAMLGFPLGEATFPSLVLLVVSAVGWDGAWMVFAGILLLPGLGLAGWLGGNLAGEDDAPSTVLASHAHREPRPSRTRRDMLKDWRFFALMPSLLMLGFAMTGLFLYQTSLAAERGWTLEWMTVSFTAFAGAKLLGSLVGGPLVDRLGASRLIPVYLVPFLTGLLVMGLMDYRWAWPLFLALAGFSQGIGSPAWSAFWAELYGTAHLASIKSFGSMLGVFSTALSPMLFGALLDSGWRFHSLIAGMAVWAVIAILCSIVACSSVHESR